MACPQGRTLSAAEISCDKLERHVLDTNGHFIDVKLPASHLVLGRKTALASDVDDKDHLVLER